jgi:tetratricopeptide (TPR) repeat protein
MKIDRPMMAKLYIEGEGIRLRQFPNVVVKSISTIKNPFVTKNMSEPWKRVEKLMHAINKVLIPSSPETDVFGNYHIWDVKDQFNDLLPQLLPFSDEALDWVQAGEAFFQANLWREAELAHRIGFECDPGNPAIQLYLAEDLDKQGLYRDAEELIEELIQANPDFTPAWTSLSRLRLFSMNNIEGAGQAAAKATQVGPNDPDAWVQFAYCLYFAGKKEKVAIASQDARQCAQGSDLFRIESLVTEGFKMLDAVRERFRKEAGTCASFIQDMQREGGVDKGLLTQLIKTHEDFVRRNRLDTTD